MWFLHIQLEVGLAWPVDQIGKLSWHCYRKTFWTSKTVETPRIHDSETNSSWIFLTNSCDLDATMVMDGHLDKTLWMAVTWPIRFGLLGDWVIHRHICSVLLCQILALYHKRIFVSPCRIAWRVWTLPFFCIVEICNWCCYLHILLWSRLSWFCRCKKIVESAIWQLLVDSCGTHLFGEFEHRNTNVACKTAFWQGSS